MPIRHVLTGLLFVAVGITAGCGGGSGGDGGASLKTPEITAAVGDGEVLLRWSGVEGIDGYTVYQATEGGIEPANFGVWMSQHEGVMIGNVTRSHMVGGLDNGTEYFFVVTATVGGQESAPSNEISAVPLPVTGKLNDTGMELCADGSRNTFICPVAGFPGQDGEFGRDADARAGTLLKMGAGAAGFDYTKIANNGSKLPASAMLGNGPIDWGCTRDNVTGLIWEVKTTDGGLRDRNNTYTWYQPDGPNMYRPGTQNGGSCTGSSCDTTGFVQAVNSQGLCGANDWRLSAVRELHTIVHHGRTSPAVDTVFFPNTLSSFFWSASAELGNSAGAKGVSFSTGRVNWAFKNFSHEVRLVRGGQ